MRVFGKIGGEACFAGGVLRGVFGGVCAGFGRRERRWLDGQFWMGG